MSAREAHRIAATLLHDVGKYVARTACNLREGQPIEGPLAAMLLRDVYETWRGGRASERFEELARELEALAPSALPTEAAMAEVRAHLREIDAREPGARAGDAQALAAVAEHARGVERELRALARASMAHASSASERPARSARAKGEAP